MGHFIEGLGEVQENDIKENDMKNFNFESNCLDVLHLSS